MGVAGVLRVDAAADGVEDDDGWWVRRDGGAGWAEVTRLLAEVGFEVLVFFRDIVDACEVEAAEWVYSSGHSPRTRTCGEPLRHQDMSVRTAPGYSRRLLDDFAVRERFDGGWRPPTGASARLPSLPQRRAGLPPTAGEQG
ncbi:hypothetical protein ABZ826_17620 [Streptomyces sp. NPDC047515]|uniref:hypothetical protein n=1 Tax=Streptomyces sp. NPDC047515 TaxID=3155380 RepID=UPI0033E99A64